MPFARHCAAARLAPPPGARSAAPAATSGDAPHAVPSRLGDVLSILARGVARCAAGGVPRPAPAPSTPGRGPRSRAGACLPALSAALLLGACAERTETPVTTPATAPDVVFHTLDGERMALREARGPTLVNFWSTDCVVCLSEMPELAQLHADYAPRGFELVAVAMPFDRPDAVLESAEAQGLPFPVALDIDGRVLAAFEPVPGTPTSFLVDADGHVVERHVGPFDVAALRRTLERLLGDARAAAAPVSGRTVAPLAHPRA